MSQITLDGVGKIYPDGTRAVGDLDLTIRVASSLFSLDPRAAAKRPHYE